MLEKIGLSRSTYMEYVERQAQKQAQRREEKASPSHLNRSWRRFQLALYLMKLVDFEMTATEVSRGVKETDGGEGEKDAYRLCFVPCAVRRVPCAVRRVLCTIAHQSPFPLSVFLSLIPLPSFQVKIERTPSNRFNPRRVPTPG